MNTSDGSIPPLLLFRSFLTIASGFVAHQMILAAATIAVAHLFFPEVVAQLQAAGQQGVENDAADTFGALPLSMIGSITVVVALASVVVGVLVGWSAPFGRMTHSIFLAVIVAVNFLGQSLGAAQEKKVVMLTYMLVFPVAIAIGGVWINRRMVSKDISQSAEIEVDD